MTYTIEFWCPCVVGALEHWRLSALEYNRTYSGSNYFSDLIAVHDLLGLVTYHGQAAAVASLVSVL